MIWLLKFFFKDDLVTFENTKKQNEDLKKEIERLKKELEELQSKFTTKTTSNKQLNHIKKLNQSKYNKTHKRIIEAITGLYKDEYIKQDGTYNIYKLSKDLNISRNTIRIHIEKIKLNIKYNTD